MELRPGRPEDESGMRELFSECHGRSFPLGLRRWQYEENPGGPAVVDVAVEAGRIVGHLASLPVVLESGGETTPGALWMDLMIHPRHRGLGLFMDLAEAHRAHCAARGCEMLFAFPNDRSYPLLKRMLDWTTIEDILAWEAPPGKLPPPPAPARRWTFETAARDPELDAFWNRVRPRRLAVRRDGARVAWRYRKPQEDYRLWFARDPQRELRGWLAAKIFSGPAGLIGDVLDFWVEDGAEAAAAGLWARSLEYFSARGVGVVSAWATRETPEARRLAALGLAPTGTRTHFAGRWTRPEEGKPFPGRGRDWIIAKGDSDVF